jgi:23S rRNA (cytosine1962-C5)-methyltransferase
MVLCSRALTDLPESITVKSGHVQPLWAGHPWVFKQAVANVGSGVEAGDEVLVIDPHGKILGRGLYSPRSAISVRLYTSQGSQPIDQEFFAQQIEKALQRRRSIGLPSSDPQPRSTGFRLVHGEGDGLPGLIVDRFEDALVVQLGTIGLQRRRGELCEALQALTGASAIIERTPASLAKLEGFELAETRSLYGEMPEVLRFDELGIRHELPIQLSQKTGYYFDQRPLRERIHALSRGSRVLDGCCYTGSIGIAAAKGGASEVYGVDRSEAAVVVAQHNAARNGVAGICRYETMEVGRAFRVAAEQGGYDIVVCDPPKLAGGRKLSGARRGRDKSLGAYRKMAEKACAAVKPGGLLAMCSCSGAVSADALQRALALGARDSRRRAVVVERLFQGNDHPVPAAFPEGLYLKILLARIEAL